MSIRSSAPDSSLLKGKSSSSHQDLQPVKGVRDFYPAQLRQRHWLFDIWRQTALSFGFEEYDACVLEHQDLYLRKTGEEIADQLYGFLDKSGRSLALRPEMTPSLARLVLQQKNSLSFPLKWFSIPQCFRYERMTRGRKREHFQWNVDIIGDSTLNAEVEILSMLVSAFQQLGLKPGEVRVYLNDRQILDAILEWLQVVPAQRTSVMGVIDKQDKITPEAMSEALTALGLSTEQIDNLRQSLAWSLSDARQTLGDIKPLQEMEKRLDLFENHLPYSGWIAFDLSIVRGLSYYTGLVFEAKVPSMRAICGGGRYDSLLTSLGSEDIAAVGFGFGDVVIAELLHDLQRLPDIVPVIDFAVIPFSAAELTDAFVISQQLRSKGFRVHTSTEVSKMGRALKKAGEAGAKQAVLLMPNEWKKGEVVIRNMSERTEQHCKKTDFLADPAVFCAKETQY